MVIQKTRVTLASAAALFAFANLGMVASAAAEDEGAQAQVAPCYGVNSCKGGSYCKSASHDCKGQNSCKGQGFKNLTAGECSAQHGSTTPK
jgi:uncharacterized membrane protein